MINKRFFLVMVAALCTVGLHGDGGLYFNNYVSSSTILPDARAQQTYIPEKMPSLENLDSGTQAQIIINHAFAQMDAFIVGNSTENNQTNNSAWYSQSDLPIVVDIMNTSFDNLATSLGRSTTSIQPVKDAFAQAITFFGTKTPNNMEAWLPKIVDAAKIVLTAPVKAAIQIGATGVGAAVGGATGALAGTARAVYQPIRAVTSAASVINFSQDSVSLSLVKVAAMIPATIAVAVKGVIEAPIIVAYETAVGAYTGGRVAYEVAKEKIARMYALREPKTATSKNNEEAKAVGEATVNNNDIGSEQTSLSDAVAELSLEQKDSYAQLRLAGKNGQDALHEVTNPSTEVTNPSTVADKVPELLVLQRELPAGLASVSFVSGEKNIEIHDPNASRKATDTLKAINGVRNPVNPPHTIAQVFRRNVAAPPFEAKKDKYYLVKLGMLASQQNMYDKLSSQEKEKYSSLKIRGKDTEDALREAAKPFDVNSMRESIVAIDQPYLGGAESLKSALLDKGFSANDAYDLTKKYSDALHNVDERTRADILYSKAANIKNETGQIRNEGKFDYRYKNKSADELKNILLNEIETGPVKFYDHLDFGSTTLASKHEDTVASQKEMNAFNDSDWTTVEFHPGSPATTPSQEISIKSNLGDSFVGPQIRPSSSPSILEPIATGPASSATSLQPAPMNEAEIAVYLKTQAHMEAQAAKKAELAKEAEAARDRR